MHAPPLCQPLYPRCMTRIAPARGGPRQPQSLRRRFASGIHKLDRLHAGDLRAEEFGQAAFEKRCAAAKEADPSPQPTEDRIGRIGIVVAERVRSKGGVVIDVAISIGIPDVSPIILDENDLGLGRPVDGDDAALNELTILREDFGGPLVLFQHSFRP